MDLITLDFETYYDRDYSLSKLTTEAYVRDPRFEVIGVAVKVNNGETEWASGTYEQLNRYLTSFPWEDAMVLCHNTMFDGAILSWRFGIRPRMYTDTLCIARALHGTEARASRNLPRAWHSRAARCPEAIPGKVTPAFSSSCRAMQVRACHTPHARQKLG